MFNRTVVVANPKPQTEYVTRTVHEHRAPTDDSVKLLREMEARARDQVIEAIHVGDTTFECVVHTQQHLADSAVEHTAVFSLNGKKLTASYREYTERYDQVTALVGLRDAIAKEIAEAVLIPSLRQMRFPDVIRNR